MNQNLEGSTWRYLNREYGIQINKISDYFAKEKVKEEGNADLGEITFQSIRDVDDIFGPECTIKINWEKKDPTQYHHGLKVKDTIRMFSSINVVITKKETRWHLSHEMTYWLGRKQKMERGRYYQTSVIHGIVFCELTNRLFEVHAEVFAKYYENYKPLIMQVLETLQCHAS